ncbi:hypothetical protein Asppvi_001750 [Aspergillus pseudoviridinutans]|uniref:Fungal calcium binding protein domain-containing protein n=1 Tax=Aspergillus pseudoviridinutans TaxID=1517512 RepID=A0A9P3ES15_9EURO|nr:uncharacterized protein Asppvi_001750 [Aspergillus pseudoviridinutans]GIJ83230.1 hypothetical protein Asppvi_001750 [Aspergillus pseudoviridinutans]
MYMPILGLLLASLAMASYPLSPEEGHQNSGSSGSTTPFLSGILSSGDCDLAACIKELEPILSSCEGVITNFGDISTDLKCVEGAVGAAFSSSHCITCATTAISDIQRIFTQAQRR